MDQQESEPPPSMRAASMTPVESKWSREGSADGDEEWGPSECVRRSQRRRNTTPIDSGSEGILEPTVKEEIKMEVTSPRVERPSSPSVSDEDLLSDRALQSVVKEEKLRCRSPSSSEDFIGFTEVDRDSAWFISNVKRNLLPDILSDSQDSVEACAEGVFIKSQRMVINYRDVDGLDDGNIFCDVCCRDFDGECPVHGPLKVIPDTKARPGIGDAERDLKTLPSSLSSGQSKNPASGNGVFAENDLPARQRLGPYEGILTTEQGQARTTGYRWQMKKGERVHHLVNAEDPSCSNWLRRVNCARSEEEQNLVAFQYRGQIYFRTSKPVPRGSELLVYYGDDSARELTVHSERSGEAVTSSPAGPSSSGISVSVQCPHCDFRCLEQQLLDRHVKRSHGHIGRNGRHKCEWCQYSTDNANSMKRHSRTHTGERPHGCSVCTARFTKRSSLNTHMLTHTGERPFSCSICTARFARRENLTTHMRTHTGERPFGCSICTARFTERSSLTKHMRTHTGERPYGCSICTVRFTQRSHLTTHMRTHTWERPYGCSICPARYADRSHLSRHIGTHTGERPYGCSICQARFTQRESLTKHMRIHTGERPYGCSICQARFTGRESLTKHMRTHTGERPYGCSICTARFTQQSHLTTHMQTHTGERPFGCSICSARFADRSHLSRHIGTHTGERPYGCSICQARFTQRSTLTIHMRTHTGERPYGCSICTARFTERSKLITHMRIHIGERPYGCCICTARFAQRSNLTKHMRTHTGERPYWCSMCTARLIDRSALIKHLQNHQG
ncbi:zinc finger protein 271-like isoform X2 [Amphibalanus amphitrite]|uniref:zinc finger protein 271-like isoform X2 n=1 Tax=Amphibalanus amphitrite TaxID=1232801 RepID=UPI001C916AD6|nr:zinc finger protein 271-like isoform X2 [Amphibalanus amphitrite]